MRLVLVTRPDLGPINGALGAAAEARGLGVVELHAGAASGVPLPRERRLIYRVAGDYRSRLVEKLIARPGDALTYDPHFPCDEPTARLASAGLPTPRTAFLAAAGPAERRAQVNWLGGWPVVVKAAGKEGGAGVRRAETLDDLETALAAAGQTAALQAYFPHERCWRVTVLGGAALAATAYAPAAGDFRSNAPGGRHLPDAEPPPGAEALAVEAARALRLDFGGVDLMEGPGGALAVAEVNFPCYFLQQQEETGVDIAGALIEWLAARH